MRVLDIDAISKSNDIAIFYATQLIHYECISSSKPDVYERIQIMKDRILHLYEIYRPTNIVMQDVLPEDVKHNQQVFKVLIYLQAAIVLSLNWQYSVKNIQLYTEKNWRSLCGIRTGRDIKRETLKKASIQLIKKEYQINVNDDISDAICLGRAYVLQHGSAF